MSGQSFLWQGNPILFRPGESLAAALAGAGVIGYGPDALGSDTRYFCGIGTCQGCLVRIRDRVVEACLTPAASGLVVTGLGDGERADEHA